MTRRFVVLLVLFISFIFSGGASAENYTWKEPEFNFAGINKIQLFEVHVHDDTRMRNFYPDPSAERTMEQLIKIALSNKGIALFTPMNEQEVIKIEPNESLIRPSMLNADLNIYKYGYSKTYIPSRIEEYTSYEKITYVDRDGRKSETTIPVTKTRVVPAYDYYVVYVDIEIMLYDPATNKHVFTYRDTRNRDSENDPTSMAKRMAAAFTEALIKAAKKN